MNKKNSIKSAQGNHDMDLMDAKVVKQVDDSVTCGYGIPMNRLLEVHDVLKG